MARPEDRMRLKDKIIDNISKAIKSIQSHHFYKAADSDSGRNGSGFTLGNVDRPCHKLCENLDHAFLHGLKNVTHGYWTIVKQFSHKGMIRDIEMLMNVTTDLGRGRAWLYASLNEGLLESYLRMLDENKKLVKKYYAKEALMLDHDRLNLLLTLITGLECVTFQLDFDQPYLDLNAYPPRGRLDSEMEDSIGTSHVTVEKDNHVVSEMPAASHVPSDSDSSSLASLDVHSNHVTGDPNDPNLPHHQSFLRTSTISSDSGFPGGGGGGGGGGTVGGGGEALSPSSSYSSSINSNFADRRSITPTGSQINSRQRESRALDSVSVSSHGSAGDPDRIQRVEHILPQKDFGDEDTETSLEVIRIKSKRGSGLSKNKKKRKEGTKSDVSSGRKDKAETSSREFSEIDTNILDKRVSDDITGKKGDEGDSICKHSNKEETLKTSDITVSNRDSDILSNSKESKDKSDVSVTSIPQIDSGVDIHSLLVSDSIASENVPSVALPRHSETKHEEPKSALAQIENKIAELCFISEEDQTLGRSRIHTADNASLTNSEDIANPGMPETGNSDEFPESTSELQPVLFNKPSINSNAKELEHLQSAQSNHFVEDVTHSTPLTNPGYDDAVDNLSLSRNTSRKPQSTLTEFSDSKKDPHQTGLLSDVKASASELEAEDDFDFYACHGSEADQGDSAPESKVGEMTAATAQIRNAHAASQLEDYMDFILQRAESPPESLSQPSPDEVNGPVDLAMSLDNNTKLQVMLDIFTKEHEKFIKMFATRENHTEGEPSPVFVLISDHCLYFLHFKKTRRKFVLSTTANLVDLIFVSTGLNDQTLNIESREQSRQKQRLWLTPGHQNLTQAILLCLTDAVKAANEHIVSVRSRFSVGSEVPLQKIALRKYISKELNVEAQDVTIHDYSLVFWEDPSTDSASLNDAVCKEGTLLLRTHDPLKGHVWKPVYVVLKDSMLCVSNHKTDMRPHSYLGLGGDQCIGCRLVSTTDRPHCVELVLSSGSGGSWFLSAASETEISEWRHSLCLAVSQGMQDPNSLTSCVPCCAVLSCSQLFMCHEDLHTKFCRTLGRAQLEDVTGISVDSKEPTYCVIEFESQEIGVSSVQWVFYFAASQDRDRHTAAVSHVWKDIYKIDLPIVQLDNIALQRHCRSYAELLRKQLSIL
ncbi:pleckstrin homology domain-containing family m member 2 [Plakobranchus ocellatus]|uniref:Pleckstrin homology domain-containing family m member 2 n=1 Tax=Plakobranchus ocellatus TaxID=259542 RepID=A0AAV4CRE1_9GAST|nr:pleckstrin homology domain-containing family m member 2 [Plakobranchus ocellatus]